MTQHEPRKRPQQARSQATFDAIVEAGAQLLVEEGFHNCSTNSIAERAGVSIGSLYQYFPNKEAIVASVVERFAQSQFELLADGLQEVIDAPLEEAVHRLVGLLIEAKQDQPELSHVLFDELPSVGQIDVMHDWIDRATELVHGALETRREDIDVEDLEMASFMVVTSCHGVIHSTIINRPDLLDDEQLVEHTARMILSYLNRG